MNRPRTLVGYWNSTYQVAPSNTPMSGLQCFSKSLFRKATGDGPQSVTAAIFWLKTRGQRKETMVNEVKGETQLVITTAHDYETPLELLKRAIKLDPSYARAYSLLSQAHGSRAVLGQADHQREADAAIAMARHAIELDPEDAWGHMMAGFAYFVVRKTAQSLDELDEAITRNPNFALAHMLRAAALAYAGRTDESLSNREISRRLSPRDHTQPANLSIEGLCHLIAGRYADAVAIERRAVQLRSNYGTAWRTLAAAAGLAGDTATAAQALAEAKRLQPSLSLAWVELYHPVVHAKDRARYIEGLRKTGLS